MYCLKYLRIAVTCWLLALSVGIFAQSAQWSLRTHIELGEATELFEQKKYDLAAKRYGDVLKHEQHAKAQFLAFMGLAEISVIRGDMKDAADYYQQALEIDQPEEDAKLLEIAEVFLASGQLEDARQSYQAFAQANPEDVRTQSRLHGLKERDQFYSREVDYDIETLSINSAHADFAPVRYKGGLAFLSGRSKAMLKKKDRRTNSAYLQFYRSDFRADGELASDGEADEEGKTEIQRRPHVGRSKAGHIDYHQECVQAF